MAKTCERARYQSCWAVGDKIQDIHTFVCGGLKLFWDADCCVLQLSFIVWLLNFAFPLADLGIQYHDTIMAVTAFSKIFILKIKWESSSCYRFLSEYQDTEAGTAGSPLHLGTHGLGPAACSIAAGSKLRKLRLSAKQQDVTFPVQARVCRGMGDMSTRIERIRKLNEIYYNRHALG